MVKKFNGLSKIVRIILLIIPAVNWIVEIVLRWSTFLSKKDVASLLIAVIATVGFGVILGYIDAICTLLTDNISLQKLKI